MAIRHSFVIAVAVVLLSAPACSADHVSADAEPRAARSDGMPSPVLTSGTRAIELGAEPTRVTLSSANGDRPRTLAMRLQKLAPGRKLFVVIRGLRAEVQPGVLYHAYLDLPSGTEPKANDPRHIGVLNFFAAAPPAPNDPDKVAYTFDITEAARALQAKHLLADRTTITLRPAGTPAAKSAIARIELVEQ